MIQTLWLPFTPGGDLAKQLQGVIERKPGPVKVKVQEHGGTQVKTWMQKSNPNKNVLTVWPAKMAGVMGVNAGATMWAISFTVMSVELKK